MPGDFIYVNHIWTFSKQYYNMYILRHKRPWFFQISNLDSTPYRCINYALLKNLEVVLYCFKIWNSVVCVTKYYITTYNGCFVFVFVFVCLFVCFWEKLWRCTQIWYFWVLYETATKKQSDWPTQVFKNSTIFFLFWLPFSWSKV